MGYSEKQFRFEGADGASIAGFRWADEAVRAARHPADRPWHGRACPALP
jgi:hypothetical protein